MFSWKRQRKDDGPQLSTPAPVSSTPTAACEIEAALEPPTPSCHADSGTASLPPPTTAAKPAAAATAATAAAAAAAAVALAAPPGTSIELAARGSDGGAPSVLERASVRTKAAYFEALIHSNTTAHIVCSADGTQHCHNFGCPPGADDEGDEAAVDGWLQDAGAASSSAGYSEVHMILRMPRAAPPQQVQPAAGPYGTAEEMEALIEQLRGELSLKEQQRQAAVEAYMRRTREVSNLQRVVQELTESRKQAVMKAASLSERYSELQTEYHRSLRIADLSRSVSKENMAKTSRTRTELRRVQLELHATKSHASRMSEKEKKARLENALLKEKVTLLERLDFEQVQESECKKVFTRYRLAETY